MTRSRFLAPGLVVALAVFFFAWHSPLLSPEGRVRGFNSDAAILALMGKKILEGRGLDIFFWGQNYVGPLTSLFIAAAGIFLGTVDPLALRLGAFAETLGGILLTWWAIRRIDGRAAAITAIALAITPPVLLRMMITPLGAEMGFFCASALFAVLMQHLTAAPGRGWLGRPIAQVAFGVLAGVSWWMNQQVVFTLLAAAIVFAFRSRIATAVIREIRIRDRLLLRPQALGWKHVSGYVEALAWLMIRAGFVLLIAFVVLDVAGRRNLPFLFGNATDALLLIIVPLVVLPLVLGEWRRWSIPADRDELAAAVRLALGFVLGYSPVWLGRIFGWYKTTYVFHFLLNFPSGSVAAVPVFLREVLPHWIGAAPGPIGIAFAIALAGLLISGAMHARTEARALLALIPLANFAFFLLAHGAKAHYLISSIGMLYGLAALGAVALWDRRQTWLRAALAVLAAISFLSIGFAARAMRRDVLNEPDPRPLLARVDAAQCAVCYADFWIAYRYRFLDGERRAWIPHLSQNRTRAESFAFQKRPGQRCLVAKDGTVIRIPHDLPIVHKPPHG